MLTTALRAAPLPLIALSLWIFLAHLVARRRIAPQHREAHKAHGSMGAGLLTSVLLCVMSFVFRIQNGLFLTHNELLFLYLFALISLLTLGRYFWSRRPLPGFSAPADVLLFRYPDDLGRSPAPRQFKRVSARLLAGASRRPCCSAA